MTISFRRRIRLLPFLWLNLGKTGISLTVGIKPIFFTFSKRGITFSASLTGTGLSYRKQLSRRKNSDAPTE